MFKKLKKEKEVKVTTNAHVEKLNAKELGNIVGGGDGGNNTSPIAPEPRINYNASKSNTGN
jgi:hypothetical protein